MTSAIFNPTDVLIVTAQKAGLVSELVKGQDKEFYDRIAPLVRSRSVSLDLSAIERIDAAGIAALVALYRASEETGNSFTIFSASPRVVEVLELVGLERILTSHNAVAASHCGSCQGFTAA
jgi:anti-anti-sigma factor